jgi:cellulose synthase/poly-beta-1,6-N-acetylglucosamine synthase-like glycosyltransferase
MAFIFWLCSGLIFSTYIGYPLLVIAVSRLLPEREAPDLEDLPTVTMLVPAYNEEAVLEEKIANCRELDYPAGRIRFSFGSDGSSDRTAAILKAVDGENFQIQIFAKRRGKSQALNQLAAGEEGEILLFSDANSLYQPDAVRLLVRHFADPEVGGVCGRLRLIDTREEGAGSGEGLYWSYENLVKGAEGRLKSVISANGAIFAVRRELFQPLPTDKPVNDDQLTTIKLLQEGVRVVYEPEALALERTSPDMEGEFQRKVRISSLNFNAFPELFKLLSPRQGFTALAVLLTREVVHHPLAERDLSGAVRELLLDELLGRDRLAEDHALVAVGEGFFEAGAGGAQGSPRDAEAGLVEAGQG